MHDYPTRLSAANGALPRAYQVRVYSQLDQHWSTLPGVVAVMTGCDECSRPQTILSLNVNDQQQLISVLNELHAANVLVLSVTSARSSL